jgi:hypothetical protein
MFFKKSWQITQSGVGTLETQNTLRLLLIELITAGMKNRGAMVDYSIL